MVTATPLDAEAKIMPTWAEPIPMGPGGQIEEMGVGDERVMVGRVMKLP